MIDTMTPCAAWQEQVDDNNVFISPQSERNEHGSFLFYACVTSEGILECNSLARTILILGLNEA